MAFIYQHDDWPAFHWRSVALGERLAAVRHRQGRLVGRMESLGFEGRPRHHALADMVPRLPRSRNRRCRDDPCISASQGPVLGSPFRCPAQ
ncbi:MAG: DUF4172 domain-containing protein [Novosphingobium sp.]